MASQARKVFAAFEKRAPGHPGRSASLNSDKSKVQNTLQMLNKKYLIQFLQRLSLETKGSASKVSSGE